MGRGVVFAVAGGFALLTCAAAHGETVADPVTKLTLFGAAFAKDGVQPAPQKATAMAFLPGRGVVAWDVTGKTAEQAKEAQIEAMGLADAQAVQREIDEAAAQKQAQLEAERSERLTLANTASGRQAGLNMPAITGSTREAGGVIPLNRAARGGNLLGVKDGDTVKGKPRLYAFAAVSGRSVGLNVSHDEAGWKNAGVTTDRDGYVGQRQAGFAWRKGSVQTSLAYVQQKDKIQLLGFQGQKDDRVMVTMHMPPQAILGIFAKKD